MCNFPDYFVIHLIPDTHLIAIMVISVEFCSFVSKLIWTSTFSILVNGRIHTSYYPQLGNAYHPRTWNEKPDFLGSIPVSDSRAVDRERLKGLYSKLNSLPELMNRRFQVGSKPPQVPVDSYRFEKRNSVDLLRAQPVCPYTTEWRLIHRAKNINDTEVIVFQPEIDTDGFQWFYTATCDRTASYLYDAPCPTCCRGIDTTRYVSTCVPKKSYIMAYARQADELNYDWTWIQIDTGCSCAISSRPGVRSP